MVDLGLVWNPEQTGISQVHGALGVDRDATNGECGDRHRDVLVPWAGRGVNFYTTTPSALHIQTHPQFQSGAVPETPSVVGPPIN